MPISGFVDIRMMLGVEMFYCPLPLRLCRKVNYYFTNLELLETDIELCKIFW